MRLEAADSVGGGNDRTGTAAVYMNRISAAAMRSVPSTIARAIRKVRR